MKYLIFLISAFLLLHCKKRSVVNVFDADAEFQRRQQLAEAEKNRLSDENQLLKIDIQGQINSEIRQDTVFVTLDRDVYLAAAQRLRVNGLEISPKATSTPTIGDVIDLTREMKCTVTSQSGLVRTYIIIPSYLKNTKNLVLKYHLYNQDTSKYPTLFKFHDNAPDTILITYTSDVSSVINTIIGLKNIVLSPYARANIKQGDSKDYKNPVDLVVTSEQGVSRTYKVIVDISYCFQIPNHQFKQYYTVNSYNPARVRTPSYRELRNFWGSSNDGFWFTSFDNHFPVLIGNDGLTLISKIYHNTATAGQMLPFGVLPGIAFSGSWMEYDMTSISRRNYNRGRYNIKPHTINPRELNVKRPVSLSLSYKYSTNGKRVKYSPSCYTYWDFLAVGYKGTSNCHEEFGNSSEDKGFGYVLLLDKSDKVIGIASIKTGNQNNWKNENIVFKYSSDKLSGLDKEILKKKYRCNGNNCNLAGKNAKIHKIEWLFSSSEDIWNTNAYKGAVNSSFSLKHITLKF